MNIRIIHGITSFCGHYLLISGSSDREMLTVLTVELDITAEFPIKGRSVWGHDFHIVSDENTALISIISTDSFDLENCSYQGFNTHWFRLSVVNDVFKFEEIDTWEKSDIIGIKSRVVDGSTKWVTLRDVHSLGTNGRVWSYGSFAIGTGLDISHVPEIKQFLIRGMHLKHVFDYIVEEDITYLLVVEGYDTRCGIIKLEPKKNRTTFQYIDVPLAQGHEFRRVRFVKCKNGIFAYVWTIQNDIAKKSQFEIYRSEDLTSETLCSKATRLVDSDRTMLLAWNNTRIAYSKGNGAESFCATFDENGNLASEEKLYEWKPIHFGFGNTVVCRDENNTQLKVISL